MAHAPRPGSIVRPVEGSPTRRRAGQQRRVLRLERWRGKSNPAAPRIPGFSTLSSRPGSLFAPKRFDVRDPGPGLVHGQGWAKLEDLQVLWFHQWFQLGEVNHARAGC